jgi:hypothetical protein
MQARQSYPLTCPGLGLCALLALASAGAANEAQYSPQQLRQDLAVIEAEIRRNHPNLAHSVDEAALARSLRELEQDLGTALSRDGAWRKFATLNPLLADGHLFVGYANWRGDAEAHLAGGGAFFPFEVHVTPGAEVFIKSRLGGIETSLAGARLQSINGVDARVVTAELLTRAHGDTPAFRAELVSRRWWFYYWKMYGAGADFDLVLVRDGERTSRRFAGSATKPLFLADEASFERQFRFELLPCHSAALAIDSFAWPDKKRFIEFTRDAFSKVRDARVQTLIIDVRANGGGDDDFWIDGILPYVATKPYRWGSNYQKRVVEQYRDEGETLGAVVSGTIDRWIQPEPDNPLRFSGQTYVLIGPSTYSSAILFANTVQHFGFAKVAGTGAARADQSGSVQQSVLPNTALVVRWPRFILTRPSGAAEPLLVAPDVPIAEEAFRPNAAVERLTRACAASDRSLPGA